MIALSRFQYPSLNELDCVNGWQLAFGLRPLQSGITPIATGH